MKDVNLKKGTKEWAEFNHNICIGCPNKCKYCFASGNAARFKKCPAAKWENSVLRPDAFTQPIRSKKGIVMFPSSHDIHKGNADDCIKAIKRLLDKGHDVLIVSKPDPEVIKQVCDALKEHKDRILFRFTIGSANSVTLKAWEPGAPSFEDRIKALKLAHKAGFKTSLSCEPMLDERIDKVVDAASPHVTNTIWLGKANRLRQQMTLNGATSKEDRDRAEALIASQSDDKIKALYARFQDNPKIEWKDSIKEVMEISLNTKLKFDK